MRMTYLLIGVATTLSACNPENTRSDDETSTQGCAGDPVCESFLDTHNTFRSQLNAGTVADDGTDGTYPIPSPLLSAFTWNNNLAAVAQSYADNCSYAHNANRQTEYVAEGGENIYIGENIAYHSFSSTSQTAANYAESQTGLWWAENDLWHHQIYDSSTINGAGHFTQMIWANSIEIGCGIALCENFNGTIYDAYFGVCNYGPGGNYIDQHPYSSS